MQLVLPPELDRWHRTTFGDNIYSDFARSRLSTDGSRWHDMTGHDLQPLLMQFTGLRELTQCAALLAWSLSAGIGLYAGDFDDGKKDDNRNIAVRRLEIMTSRIENIAISSPDPDFPRRMSTAPLFRYDDETRGYVDGTVWRLGEQGRPLAIITAELHPRYLNGGPRVVYDFLSLTDRRFTARSADIPGWSPHGSAVDVKPLPGTPVPSSSAAKRLTQLKQQARRFSGTQEVEELEKTFVHLRLLPREIDRYSPGSNELADGALFVFANGRNPALLLVIETDGIDWQYGIGRLSMPSTLEMRLDDAVVWTVPRIPSSPGWSEPYNASNSPAVFP
jgi:hypothetical protein